MDRSRIWRKAYPMIDLKDKKEMLRGSVWTRRSYKGRRVTTPLPRGKKSKPTMFSNNELFPLDCVPRTAILGSEIYLSRP